MLTLSMSAFRGKADIPNSLANDRRHARRSAQKHHEPLKPSARRLMTHTEVSYADTSRWKNSYERQHSRIHAQHGDHARRGLLELGARRCACDGVAAEAASGCGLSFQGSIGTRQGRRSFPNASPRQRVLRHGARLPFVVDCRRGAFRGERFMHSLQVLAPGLFNLDIAAIDARAPPGMVISPDLRLNPAALKRSV